MWHFLGAGITRVESGVYNDENNKTETGGRLSQSNWCFGGSPNATV